MKKSVINILVVFLGLITLINCNKENGIGQTDEGSITIQASIGIMTRVSYDGNGSSFTSGDTLLLYGWTGGPTAVPEKRVVDAVKNSFDGNGWIPSNPMLWKNSTAAHYFIGIYPVPDSVTSFTEAAYTLDTDDYESSDLLIATNLSGVKATDGPVNLNFDHVMAKLNVNLKFRNEYCDTATVDSVKIASMTTASVNYLTKEVTATGNASTIRIPSMRSALEGFDYSFSSIMVPQTDVRMITVSVGEKKYVYTTATDIPLESGKNTTLSLTLGRDLVELDDVSVADWLPDMSFEVCGADEEENISNDLGFPYFKSFCIANYDTNRDGWISKREAEAVTVMDVSSQYMGTLYGIGHFVNLTYLDCSSTDIWYLDVSNNLKLEYLDCRDNDGLEEIHFRKGQVINEFYRPKPIPDQLVTVGVNGQYSIMLEKNKMIRFTAQLYDSFSAESLTWKSDVPGFADVSHLLKGSNDTLMYNMVNEIGDMESGKLYTMYAETPDGIKSNPVRFGIFGKDPIIYFEKPMQRSDLGNDRRLWFSVFFYPGEGESGTPSIKTIGEGCNRSFNSGVKIEEDESIHWNKPGLKQVIVYFEKNGKRTSDTLFVNVVIDPKITE